MTELPSLKELIDDPVRFARVFGFELQPWQEKILLNLAYGPNVDGTAGVMDAAVMRRGKEVLKAGDKTSYTVMDKANARLAAQELLITGQEVKTLLDGIVKVGTAEGRNMVFNKWEAANKIAQIVNDRFNAQRRK